MNGLEVGLVCAVVLLGPFAVRAVVHERRHRRHARQITRMTGAETARWEQRAAMTVPEFRGSMVLAEERALDYAARTDFLPAPELAHGWRAGEPVPLPRVSYWPPETWPDWLDQTAAELAPEALDQEESPWPGLALMTAGLVIADALAHSDPGPGVEVSSSAVSPGPVFPGLGPNAARVLARYERRFHERWGCRLPAEVAA